MPALRGITAYLSVASKGEVSEPGSSGHGRALLVRSTATALTTTAAMIRLAAMPTIVQTHSARPLESFFTRIAQVQ